MTSSSPRIDHRTPLLSSASSIKDSEISDDIDIEDPTQLHQAVPSVADDVLPEDAVLSRHLGWYSAYILIISRVIRSGIFATPGSIVRSVGSIGLSLVLWIAGAIIAWFGLMVTLEYGCMLPRSGGDKVYLEFTYRRPRFLATVLITISSVMLGFTASNCIVFAEYVLFATGRSGITAEIKVIAAALLAGIVIMHSCFLKTGIVVQNALGYIKIGTILFMICAGLFAALLHRNSILESTSMANHSAKTTDQGLWFTLWDGSVWNWGVIATSFFKVFYSYAGLHNVNNVMNEVKDPVRTLKSSTQAALLTTCVLYAFINIAYFMVVPLDRIKESGELIAALFFEQLFGPHLGRIILPLAVALSAAGNVMVVTFSHARMIQEIARQGFLPFQATLASIKPFNAPMGALITHFIPSLLVITIPTGDVYSFILEVEGYPAQFFTLASSFGLLWLRAEMPDLRRPYRAFIPAVWLRIALSFALLAAPFVPRSGSTWRQHLSSVSYAFVGTSIITFAVLYWYIRTVFLPRRNGYRLGEAKATLSDGTTVTRLTKVKLDVSINHASMLQAVDPNDV
ncbi:low-affinity methionine permease [Recurvomyces mirabilis]|uniref:Low-affinity methionine permease n=1 Tax=Recurvomyces mirabilis TaxID=574656 RepID=A0AAE0TTN2_9PEZI|nr:low-affinity methionine permease [Recurvomyces mirabilis]KAK5156309.1 low-affinity methionine permease [Recurvomyces mirabilis]